MQYLIFHILYKLLFTLVMIDRSTMPKHVYSAKQNLLNSKLKFPFPSPDVLPSDLGSRERHLLYKYIATAVKKLTTPSALFILASDRPTAQNRQSSAISTDVTDAAPAGVSIFHPQHQLAHRQPDPHVCVLAGLQHHSQL